MASSARRKQKVPRSRARCYYFFLAPFFFGGPVRVRLADLLLVLLAALELFFLVAMYADSFEKRGKVGG